MTEKVKNLLKAEAKAAQLFVEIEQRGLIKPGKNEHQINNDIFKLAFELFSIKKYWHKRIVRSGKNTLLPYKENPPNLTIQSDDILFFDFGPVFDEWEADYGRTYVLGNNTQKLTLKNDVASAWQEGCQFYNENKSELTGADFYNYTKQLAIKYGWHYGNIHCGHLIGNFPHEIILGEELINYIHPENNQPMLAKDKFGNDRNWIYEIHFINNQEQIGGFFEQMMV